MNELHRPDLLAVLCACGCGEETPIAARTLSREGRFKGKPNRFIRGHNTRVRPRRPPRQVADLPVDYERFWSKVGQGDNGCWAWRASLDAGGYGQFELHPTVLKAHRVSWELMLGPIPEGLPLDHLCRNRACVNPEHLEPVTHRVNALRGLKGYALRTFCKSGRHDITLPENVYVRPTGKRQCRPCIEEASRRRHAKA